jgi:transglutaminase-like putative cysteine protease
MARRADPAPGHQRLLGLAAVAALSVATALAFGRVFTGRLPTLELVGVALASVAVAVAFERRGLFLATMASLLGLTLAIAWIVLPQTTWYGVPSLRTLRALGRSLEFVGQQAREQVAPTTALPPLMLAAVTAVWTAAFSSHALAIRAGSPLLAVLPPIALVGFADTVLEDGARPVYAIVLLAAAIAVVFADGLRRVRQWGPVWSGSSKARRVGPSVRGSRPVALTVIALAVLVPGLLPGFRSDPLVDLSSSSDSGSLDPFVSIHAQLTGDAPERKLFEVQTQEAHYWRLYTLDHFDGESWTSTNPDGSIGGLPVSVPGALEGPPQAAAPPGSKTLDQTYRILDDVSGQKGIPMAQTPVAITSSSFDEVTWDPARETAFVDGDLGPGTEYTVRSNVVVPSAQQVQDLQYLDRPDVGPWTQVPPEGLDPRITKIAEDWTAGDTTDFEKVNDIIKHFHDGVFTYSEDVEELPEGQDAIVDFLQNTKVGFCQQYAVSAAVLLRALGLPARVAVGYQDGTLQNDGSYMVTNKNAHAWVEVLFPVYGWLPFEPTPGHGSIPGAAPGTYINPGRPSPSGGFIPPGGTGVTGATGASGPAGQNCDANVKEMTPQQRQLLCQVEKRPEHVPGGGFVPVPQIGTIDAPDGSGYSVPYRWIFLGLLVALVVLLITVPIVKAAWRKRLLRRSHEPREHVLAAYRVFDGEAADIGLGRRDGETIEEHRARLMATIAFSNGHLGRLTSLAAQAAYAPEAPTRSDADGSVEDARQAIKDLRKEAGLFKRITGTYRPGL